jgi:peptidoglycan/xylan/chitin deacetylase (PgdA/CDA1 family)
MRQCRKNFLAVSMLLAASGLVGPALAQTPPAPSKISTPAAAPPPAAAPAPAVACKNPNALGVERTVEIDTTGGPGFGFEHFKSYDFLRPGEVVLTFDDGPWPGNTPAVLAALADQCTKAIFFPIGKHTVWHPEILRQVKAAGHTIGSHTWSHKDLSKLTLDQAKEEYERGASAVNVVLGGTEAPFFRFPALRHPPEMLAYLGQRNVAVFSTDFDSFDFKMHKPDQVVKSVMTKLKKRGKGIILMHDFQHATAQAIGTILAQLKAGGYKVVFMKAKDRFSSLPQYDEEIKKQLGGGTADTRPLSSVVKTVQ